MKDDIIKRIEELKLSTTTNIAAIQHDCCPRIYDANYSFQFSYFFEGYEYYIYEDYTQLYAVSNIPYTYMSDSSETYIDTMINLVNKQKVFPFIFFINGRAMPWSKITIIKDYNYSYIVVRDIEDDESYTHTIMYFPTYQVRYGEDDDIKTDLAIDVDGLYFDEDGKLITTGETDKITMRVEVTDPDICIHIYEFKREKLYVPLLGVENGQIALNCQIIGFRNNMEKYTDTNSYFENPLKKYEWSWGLFNIYPLSERILNNTNASYHFITCYYKKGMVNLSPIYTKDLDYDKIKYQLQQYWSADYNEELDWLENNKNLFNKFDFVFDKNIFYGNNLDNALKYIAMYDYSLFNKVIQDRSKVHSECYYGSEFKELVDENNYVRYSRKRSDYVDDYVMMFVNGKIYKNHIDITYTTNTIDIPVVDISNNDLIEIIFFTEVVNDILDVVVEGNQVPVYISPIYNLNECDLFDTSINNGVYNIVPSDNRTQFKLEYTYTSDNNHNYKILFEDNSHYGNTIALVPKRQFRYYRYIWKENCYKRLLPMSFNYCHEINQFMVFVNGIKIDKREFTITIMNKYRPFDQMWLYLSTILENDDVVEIFYVPEKLNDIFIDDKLENDGTLRITQGFPNLYSLSKNTAFVFINGLKIHPSLIDDISMDTLKINTEINTIDNIVVTEYQYGDEDLRNYLLYDYILCKLVELDDDGTITELGVAIREGDKDTIYRLATKVMVVTNNSVDDWTKYVRTAIKNGSYNKITKLYDEITDPIKNYKDDYAELKSILYQVLIDFYLYRTDVNTGSSFVYDFEREEFKLTKDDYTITLGEGLVDKLLDYRFIDDYVTNGSIPEDKDIEKQEIWLQLPLSSLGTSLQIPYTTNDNTALKATVFEKTIETREIASRVIGHDYDLSDHILNMSNVSDYNTDKDLIVKIVPVNTNIAKITTFGIPNTTIEFKADMEFTTDINVSAASTSIIKFTLLSSSIIDTNSMFIDCNKLKEVFILPSNNLKITNSMFKNCSSLISVNMFNTTNVTDFGSMFMGCTNIEELPLYNTRIASNASNMFNGCISLKTIPQYDFTNLKDSSYMFYNCAKLESIPRIVTTEVLDMSHMFYGCNKLISVPELNCYKCINTDSAFYNCVNLVYLGLNNLKTDLDLKESKLLNIDSVSNLLKYLQIPVGILKEIRLSEYVTIKSEDKVKAELMGWTISIIGD